MTIDMIILIQMMFGAFFGTILYTIIGVIPGTDETAVLAPLTIILFALGLHPLVVLTFFIASMVTLNTTSSIPTALTGIPGGVMSTPFIPASNYLKEQGKTSESMRKMTMGSIIGTLTALVFVIFVGIIFYLIEKYFKLNIKLFVQNYSGIIFIFGAILLSFLSKNKVISLLFIIPLALIIGFIEEKTSISGTPFFLSITSGPLLYSLVLLFIPKVYNKSKVKGDKKVYIEELAVNENKKGNLHSVFKILNKNEFKTSIIASIFSSFTFFLSPVGMSLLIGESLSSNVEDETEKAFLEVTVMNSLKNNSYLVGVIISLLILNFAISPAAMGPAGGFFDQEQGHVLYNFPFFQSIISIIIGVFTSLLITGFLSLKYATKLTKVVFKYIPQEAVVALLLSLIVLLVFMNSGFIGVLIIFMFSVFSGFINKLGVPFGVQFMTLYSSAYIYEIILGLF